LAAPDVEAFLTDLAVARRVAASTQNQAKSALLCLYKEVLGVELPWLDRIEKAKAPTRLPVVLTQEEIARVLAHLSGIHALIGRLLYGTGMRVMEGMRLRVKDVDFARHEILFRDGKDFKDRVTMLPLAIAAPFVRHAPARSRVRYPHRPGTAGTLRRQYHHDLHACPQPRRPGRGQPARPCMKKSPLNPAGKKHRFSTAWMHTHLNDHYVTEARRLGYRSRAAFKLTELAAKDHLFRPGMTVVDLGSAPGSWSQVLREKLGSGAHIVALDQLPMDPVPGVLFILGDFREDAAMAELSAALAGRKVDLVVSDLAPNLSGVASADQARSVYLGELAVDFAASWLKTGGDLVVKAFQGEGFQEFQRTMQAHFDKVYVRKPKASRDKSREVFLVGKGHVAA